MPRVTITLSEQRYQALKQAAARQRKTLVTVIDESLELYGIKTVQTAADLVAQARQRSRLNEADALALSLSETQANRQRQ